MEPLGASDLNEELDDDLQVSTDIIVATVFAVLLVFTWQLAFFRQNFQSFTEMN
jgi:hypothetical protein